MAMVALVAIGGLQTLSNEADQELEYTAAVVQDGGGTSGNLLASGSVSGGGGSGGGSVGGFGTTDTDPANRQQAAEATTSFEDFEESSWVAHGVGEKIGAWTVVEGSVDPFRNAATTHGDKALDLNGHEPGTIETELRVARGATYRLSMLIGENHCGSAVKTGRVFWNENVVGTFAVDTGQRGKFEEWSFDLPPNGEDTGTLRIQGTNPGSCGAALELASVNLKLR